MNVKAAIERAVGMTYPAVWIVGLLCAGPSVAQQRPVFETTVARIRVDVIVTDDNGRFVEDLGVDDFVLLEDGEPQEILGVELVDTDRGMGSVVFPMPVSRANTSPVASGAGGAAAVAPRAGAAEPRDSDIGDAAAALVFLVDLPGMDWRNKARFADAWEGLLADTDALGMPRAVYMIDQVGRLRELAPLTFDLHRLRAAAAAVSAEPLVRKSQRERLGDEGGGDSGLPLLANSIEERARTRATLNLLTQFCKALGARGGRTSLVWVTSEVQIARSSPRQAAVAVMTETDPGAPSGDPLPRGGVGVGPFTADTRILRLQQELHRAANSANVSIYALDPTPAWELHNVGASGQTHSAGWALALESPLVQFSLAGLRDALKSAAAETGGKAFIHWAEPAEAIRAIEADAVRFYLLTYANPEPIGDGDYHEIRVEVKDRDLNVRARSGYTDYPTDELAERTLSGALNVPGMVGGKPLAARVLRNWSPTGEPLLDVALRRPEGLGSDTAEFELHGLAVRADGGLERTLEQRIRDAPGVAPSPVYLYEWDLPPGSYDLNLVVRDPMNGTLQATVIPAEVPEPTSVWETSDVVLMIPDDAGRPIPLIGDALVEDATVAAYVEIVFGQAPVLSGELFDASGTESVVQLPPVALQQGSDGIFRGALRMTGMPAGAYSLQVMVTDATAGKHRVFRLPIRVRGR